MLVDCEGRLASMTQPRGGAMKVKGALVRSVLLVVLGLGWLGAPVHGCSFCEDRTVRFMGIPIGGTLKICRPATSGEEGTTVCEQITVQGNAFCQQSGTFCSVITAGSGG